MNTGRAPAPLHVVGRCILERHVGGERLSRDPELEQRRVLEHRERPLVRVRDERKALVPQCGDPSAVGIGGLQGVQDRGSATVVSTTSPASVNRSSRPLAANASQSVAPSAVRPRTMSPSRRNTRPSGSRNDPPSGAAPLLVAGLVAPKAEEPLRPTPVHLARHDGAGDSGDQALEKQAAGAGIEIREHVIHASSHPFVALGLLVAESGLRIRRRAESIGQRERSRRRRGMSRAAIIGEASAQWWLPERGHGRKRP